MMDDGQGYLVTVSDLMAGLLFIFIITLMIFVLRFEEATANIRGAERTRAVLLRTLQEELELRDLAVTVDTLQGVLRLNERSINFPQGSADPVPAHVGRVRVLAEVLTEVLPCFVATAREECAREDLRIPSLSASVNVLMVEGHTDSLRVGDRSRFRSNLELSGGRAAAIHELLVAEAPLLGRLRNRDGSQILSISGYGAQQPLIPEDPLDAANRRIDLRFLMEPPSVDPNVVREVDERLGQGG
jgi:flagellar motor protein MotB